MIQDMVYDFFVPGANERQHELRQNESGQQHQVCLEDLRERDHK